MYYCIMNIIFTNKSKKICQWLVSLRATSRIERKGGGSLWAIFYVCVQYPTISSHLVYVSV